ncbi:hypothetical protein Tco_0370726 [Tanacetum coccineum]
MEYFDLWDSCVIKSLKPPKNGNQLRFLIQRVPSGRTSNALSIPHRVMTNALTQSGLIRSFHLKASATTFAFPGWCGRRCPILDYFNLGRVNVNSSAINYVPKKLHGDLRVLLCYGSR